MSVAVPREVIMLKAREEPRFCDRWSTKRTADGIASITIRAKMAVEVSVKCNGMICSSLFTYQRWKRIR